MRTLTAFFAISILTAMPAILLGQPVHRSDLKPGDVFLYHGTATISSLIRFFDGSDYSHTGIYFNDSVLEAVSEGVKLRGLDESVNGVAYVDIYRWVSGGIDTLGSAGFPAAPVLARCEWYHKTGDRYAYEELFLLSILASVRHIPLPIVMPLVRIYLDRASAVLPILLSENKEPMICSELIYRVYAEADTAGKYRLKLVGTEERSSLTDIFSVLRDAAMPVADSIIDANVAQRTNPETEEFLKLYAKAKKRADAKTKWTTADFVTPHDLVTSPNLKRVGRLEMK
ncbi:MAG TPA: hypothetical protein VEW28_06015 [Candidatus Kapabacteria bacterium]|nr:hypothetical protein [Candidatus Kapabacteria bacterium]HYM35924.1 hypothetical protein [Steroidobacteraceae bacterium]